jgi:hypothetical protein
MDRSVNENVDQGGNLWLIGRRCTRTNLDTPLARQEWEQVRGKDPIAGTFLLARIRRVATEQNSVVEAQSDLYDYNSQIYSFTHGGYSVYYTIVSNQVTSGDVILLICGDKQDPLLNSLAHRRRANV